jgi:hypothetical protein
VGHQLGTEVDADRVLEAGDGHEVVAGPTGEVEDEAAAVLPPPQLQP